MRRVGVGAKKSEKTNAAEEALKAEVKSLKKEIKALKAELAALKAEKESDGKDSEGEKTTED